MTFQTNNGMIEIPSRHSVDETVARLKGLLDAKGVTLFAFIDHSGEAQKAGLVMPPTKLLIFGNPTAGTALMLDAPTTAIDLPLKILVREDPYGSVVVAYNSPAWLQQRHNFANSLLPNIAAVEAIAAEAAE
jgi:uncharacterized protein (DUF302 family)